MNEWIKKNNSINIENMSKVLKISPMMAQILANRGIDSKNNGIRFLNPKLEFLGDISSMKGVLEASEIILDGIKSNSKIVIYGDYDVDGVCSTAILLKSIRGLGGNADYYIPDRKKEGYGLNLSILPILASKFDILIAVDNGISAIDEVELGIQLGLKIIIIDHHEPYEFENLEILPNANAIINPKQRECQYSFKLMCAAGLSYRFSEYLYKISNKEFFLKNELLSLSAIATYCDIVDLVSENRIIAKEGINILRKNDSINLGLNYLIKSRNIENKDINAYSIGFIIGPCINAAGRLDSASIALDLLLSENEDMYTFLSNNLIELNDKRKELCEIQVENAIKIVGSMPVSKILVLYLPDADESIAGIIAGRLKEKFFKPTFIFTNSEDEYMLKCSARSIPNYNIFKEMQKLKELFVRFGGHPMAAGALIQKENFDLLKDNLEKNCKLEKNDFIPKIEYEEELFINEIIFEFAQSLDILEPFGKSNQYPIFITRNVLAKDICIIGNKRNSIRMYFLAENGRKVYAVSFNSAQKFIKMLDGIYNPKLIDNFSTGIQKNIDSKMDIAYNININDFNGNKYLQLNIIDFVLK